MIHDTIIQKIQRGLKLTRSSAKALVQHKALTVVPVAGFVTGLALFILFILSSYRITWGDDSLGLNLYSVAQGVVALTVLYVCMVVLNTFVTAIAAHNLLGRFGGRPTTLFASIRAAWAKKRSLLAFALTTSIVGYMVGALISKLPFAGRIVGLFTGLSWGVANFFSIPVIMANEGQTMPPKAIAKSTKTVKKLWKEGYTTQFALGTALLITLLAFYVILIVIGKVFPALRSMSASTSVLLMLGMLVVAALVIAFYQFVSVIARTALYVYALTGKQPEEFDLSIIKTSMTVNKAKKIFS